MSIIELLPWIIRAVLLMIICYMYMGMRFKMFTIEILPLFIYMYIVLIIEFTASALNHNNINNIVLLHFLMPFQFIVFSLFFFRQVKNQTLKKFIRIAPFFIIPFLIVQYVNEPELLKKHNPIGYVMTYVPIIMYSIFSIYESISKSEINTYGLINIGVFLYFTSSLLVFISMNILTNVDRKDFGKIYIFNNGMYLLFLILVGINIWRITHYKIQV